MSRAILISSVATITLAIAMAGCASGLLDLRRTANLGPAQGEDWGPTGRSLHAPHHGVVTISYRPQVGETGYGDPMFATTHLYLHETDTRVSPIFVQPYVRLWNAFGAEVLGVEVPHWMSPPRFTPDGKRCLLAASEGIKVFDIEARTLEPLCAHGVGRHTISNDGRTVALEEGDGTPPQQIRIFDLATGSELITLAWEARNYAKIQFVDGDRALAAIAATYDHPSRITVWSLASGDRLSSVKVPVSDVGGAFSPDGKRYAVMAEDHAIRVWDTRRGIPLYTTGRHTSHVWTVAFSPNGRLLASAGEGLRDGKQVGEIRIWDAVMGRELAMILDDTSWGVTALAFSPEGDTLASGNGDGWVRFWKVPDEFAAPKSRPTLAGMARK